MKKSERFLRMLGVAGLLIGLLSATVAPTMAQVDDTIGVPGFDMVFETVDPSFLAGDNTIYYPWVANDDDFGLGAADTSISVQNLEDRDSQIWIYVGNGDGTWSLATSAYLSRFASKTFTAGQLGIAEGDGAPVAVTAFHRIPGFTLPGVPAGGFIAETPVILSNPVADDEADGENDGGNATQVIACVVNAYTANGEFGSPWPFTAAVDFTWGGNFYAAGDPVEWSTQADLQDILNEVNAGNTGELINPFGGINADGDCYDAFDASVPGFLDSVSIGGVAKQAVDGESLPMTTSADTAVSGYNALNGIEVYQFDEWYLPIVQTNCGPGGCWDSMIRVANVSDLNSAVTIRFFPADDGSGSLQTGFQVQELVNGGDTWSVNLGDLVPEGWVGSAHIYSDGAVFAMVDRYKVGYNMWITNTGSSADWENIAQVPSAGGRYALFAPHVLMDYYGWNTGINVANLVTMDNNISIQYFNMLGNATQVLNQRLAAHGMTYFYDPSIAAQDNNSQDVTSDPNAGVVGSAIIWSDYPVAAAVDATKYPETDPNGGADLFQATSYSATANIFTWQAVPLVQKGSATDGMGDTSGINIMNPNASAVTANVYFVNPSGFNAQNFGTSSVTIPGFANGFVYTLWQHNLPNGFVGAAQVVASQPVAAVSANVNYEVDGDGSAIFNAFNPCGLYRVSGICSFGDVFEPSGQTVTKTFLDPEGAPVAGVGFEIVSTPDTTDFPYQRSGVSGLDGSRTFTDVPVGVYDLVVTSVPAGFEPIDPTEVQETFIVTEGADVELVNILEWGQTFTKTVIVAGSAGDDDIGVTLSGVDVVVYEQIGTDGFGFPVAGEVVFTGQTDADGQTGAALGPGDYVLCLFDTDGVATLPNGEEVPVDLPSEAGMNPDCEAFTTFAEANTDLVNEVFLDGDAGAGAIDIQIFGSGVDVTSATLAQMGDDDVAAAGIDVNLDVDSAATDEDGQITFTGLDDGTYTIEFDFNNPVNGVITANGGPLNVTNVTWDDTSVTFDYNITGDVAQDGVLHDNENEGSPDLYVEVLDPLDGDGPPPSLVKGWYDVDTDTPVEGVEFCLALPESLDCIADTDATSGANGVGLVYEVDPGTYDLVVTAWPDGSTYEPAAPVTVDEGIVIGESPVGILNILPLDATPESDNGTIIKMWYDLDGEDVVAGIEFCPVAEGAGDCAAGPSTSDADGVAEFGELAPDTYSIVVSAWPVDSGYEPTPPVTVDSDVVVGSNAYTGLLNLLPLDGDGLPEPPAEPSLVKGWYDVGVDAPAAGIEFCLAETGTHDCIEGTETVSETNGVGVIYDVEPGTYDLVATSWGDGPAYGSVPYTVDPEIVLGEEPVGILNLLPFGAIPGDPISGTIVKMWYDLDEGDVVPGIEICPVHASTIVCSGPSATSDDDGVAQISGLDPVIYDIQVNAWPDGSDYEPEPPVIVDTDISVGNNSYTALLNLLPLDGDGNGGDDTDGALTKTFTDDDDNPVAGVVFCLAPTGAAGGVDDCVEGSEGTTGAGGSATVVVPEGAYDLYVTSAPPGYEAPVGPQDSGLLVQAGQTTTLDNDIAFATGDGLFIKRFQNLDGDAVEEVEFCIAPSPSSGAEDCTADGITIPDGTYSFLAPAGLYDLYVTAVPDGYELPEGVQETVRILAGVITTMSNTLFDADTEFPTLLIGLNADLDALGLAEITVDVYAVPNGETCETVVGNSAFQLATGIELDAGDFLGASVNVAALEVDPDLLNAFGAIDEDALVGLGLCLAVSADLVGGGVLDADILVPATINAVGENYVADAEIDSASINVSLLSALTNLVPGAAGLLDVTVYSNPGGASCDDTSGMTVLETGGIDVLDNLLPVNVCIEVSVDALGLITSTAVIGADLSTPTSGTLQIGVTGLLELPPNPRLTLSFV